MIYKTCFGKNVLCIINFFMAVLTVSSIFPHKSSTFNSFWTVGNQDASNLKFEYLENAIEFIDGSWSSTIICDVEVDDSVDVSWHFPEYTPDGQFNLRRVDYFHQQVDEVVPKEGLPSTLIISNIDASKVGLYNCLIAKADGYLNVTYLLDAKPIINDGSNDNKIIVSQDDNVSITCTSYSGAELFWRLPLMHNYEPQIDYNSDGVNATTVLNLFVNFNQSSDNYQCCSSNGINDFPASCTDFSVLVKSPVEASMNLQCSSVTSKCLASCNLNSYPLPDITSIDWRKCDVNNKCAPLPEYSNEAISNFTILSTTLFEIDDSINNITCYAKNEIGGSEAYQVLSSKNLYSPIPVQSFTNFKVYPATDSYSTNITCSFSSNPDSEIQWIKQNITGNSFGLEVISNSASTLIYHADLQTLTTISLLYIPSYMDEDKANYMCQATNEVGWKVSQVLQPYLHVDYIEFDVKDNAEVYAGDNIELNCIAHSFPPPKIVWSVIAEFPLNFTIQPTVANWATGNSSSTIEVDIDSNNNFIYFQCIVYNDFLPSDLLTRQGVVNIYHAPINIDIGHRICTPDNFTHGSNCTLMCDVQIDSSTTLKDWQWRYFISSPNDYTTIDSGTSIKAISPYRWRTELTLTSYNAWYYQCWSYFEIGSLNSNYTNLTQDFKINPTEAYIGLGSICTASSDCATLYSNCSEQLCSCIPPFDIPLDDQNLTLECLSGVDPGKSCKNSNQCAEKDPNYYCDLSFNRTCQCAGWVTTISNSDLSECIKKVYYNSPCTYAEECILADPNTDCENICVCRSNYVYDQYSQLCEVDVGSLSTTAIIIISVSGFLVLAIIFTFTAGYIRRRRITKRNKNVTHNRSEIISEISGIPYNQHDDYKNIPQKASTSKDIPLDNRSFPDLAAESSTASIQPMKEKHENSVSEFEKEDEDKVLFY